MATDFPRLIYEVPKPPALYLRPGKRDHKPILSVLSEGRAGIAGLVIEPTAVSWQEELLQEARAHRVETLLDPKSLEMGTAGGLTPAIQKLPWAGSEPHSPSTLEGAVGRSLVAALVEFAAEHGFSGLLAPTHYLGEPSWLSVDRSLTLEYRRQLDAAGLDDSPLYYVLSLPSTALRHQASRRELIDSLRGLPIDAIWLRVHPFGSASGPLALKRYIEAAQDFHQLGIPVVGERTGFAGLALSAFGAVSGIESGLTLGERFDAGSLIRPRTGEKPFLPPPRVYLSEIGLFMTRNQARGFFENRYMKTRFACKDRTCCRRGFEDMIADPRRHFLVRRMSEVARLGRVPPSLRPQAYLDKFLRPATDLAVAAARADASLERLRHRLDSWRITLSAALEALPPRSHAVVPSGHRIRHRLGA